jgi:hypothetical protein
MELSMVQGRAVISHASADATLDEDTTTDGDPFDGLPIPRAPSTAEEATPSSRRRPA